MKLSAWAKANGLADQTAWRRWRAGKLPVPAEQRPTGTVIVHPPKAPAVESVAIDARGSSGDQKADLERQLGRLAAYASRERLTVIGSVSEIGFGLNGHRSKIMRLLSDPAVQNDRRGAPRPAGAIGFGVHRGGARGLWAQAHCRRPDRDEGRLGARHGRGAHIVLCPPLRSSCSEEPAAKALAAAEP